jgi:rhodanese-related sulfurtransferase
MSTLLEAGASPSITDKEGAPHDATAIVATYKAMARRSAAAAAAAKDEL